MSEEGMALLADTVTPKGQGEYLVARLDEWAADQPIVTAWRGPEKAEEHLPRMRLHEVTCGTLLVDPKGFWFCTVPDEEVEELIDPILDRLISEAADRDLAGSMSWYEPYVEDFGDQVWVTATFGDATGVNGEIQADDEDVKPPRGYVKTDRGGKVPSEEAELDKEQFYRPAHYAIERELGRSVPLAQVAKIIDRKHPKPYIYSGGSGETEIWAPRKAVEEFERQSSMSTAEKQKAQEEARRRDREARRAARRRAIREGKFGAKQDWSPRGQIPGMDGR